MLHLVPPQPVLVELREAVHHDRDGEREDEDAGEGAEASNQFSQECLGVEVISDSCNGHKAPPADEEKELIVFFQVSPEGLDEGPGVAGVVGGASAREVEFPTRAVEHFFPIHPLLQSCTSISVYWPYSVLLNF